MVYILAGIVAVWCIYCLLPTIYYKKIRRNDLAGGSGPGVKNIMLTFDDGPDEEYTGRLLDLLKEHHIKAVFFLLGEKVEALPGLTKRIAEEGHQIGLHGTTHKDMWLLGFTGTRKSFKGGYSILAAQGITPVCYRPPHGNVNLFTIYYARKYNLPICLWTTAAQDWKKGLSSQDILMRLRRRAKPGDVLLLHDSGRGTGGAEGAPSRTIQALTRFLPEMKEFGYQFTLFEKDGEIALETKAREECASAGLPTRAA